MSSEAIDKNMRKSEKERDGIFVFIPYDIENSGQKERQHYYPGKREIGFRVEQHVAEPTQSLGPIMGGP